ncbi:MAG: hypothetical protein KDB03_15700 [Planctomycetales bacterium]|nr:hypothetical protein [Planctomycetales bacterium]
MAVRLSIVAWLVLANWACCFEVNAVLQELNIGERTARVVANGQERTVPIAADVMVLSEGGKALADGLMADELQPSCKIIVKVEMRDQRPTIVSIQLGEKKLENAARAMSVGRSSVGFKPLTEMSAADSYHGELGGLYGRGQNKLPEKLATLAAEQSALVQSLDRSGKPATDGTIGLISISMSNATQEFSKFKEIADADDEKSPRVSIVDCAQGGQTMARWADEGAACWQEALRRLADAKVSPLQVQVVWLKLANAQPSGELQTHGRQLERDTQRVIGHLAERFPNLRVIYLGSRIYGGYADGNLNPEPFAYEGAFVVRWLIDSQLTETAHWLTEMRSDGAGLPVLLWGPYFWADGLTPRESDELIWRREDFVNDGTHPSQSGRLKVAKMLLAFFKTDELARRWFVRHP